MLNWLSSRRKTALTATELYGSIVTQARQTVFYERLGVPDTIEGRLGVLVLVMFLAMDRLSAEGEPGRALAQALAETFVTDMDDNMREIGISDLKVPTKVKKAGAALYERMSAYKAALEQSEDHRLAALISEHVYDNAAAAGGRPLARYLRRGRSELAAQPGEDLLAGRIALPEFDPAAITAGQGEAIYRPGRRARDA